MNNNLEDNICKAINIIAKRIVDKANYDRVVKGEVFIENIGEEDIYRVKVGEVFYPAAAIGREEYFSGDNVYLLIPQNDTNNTKFILGREGDFKIRKFPKEEHGIEVDAFLSLVSENPVQNKIIKKYIDETFALKKYYQNDRIKITDNSLNEVGKNSMIIGDNSAESIGSISIGNNNSVKGDYSFAHGEGNLLNSKCSFVSGEQNIINKNLSSSFIIGGKNNEIIYENDILQAYAEAIINSENSTLSNSAPRNAIINSLDCLFSDNSSCGLIINSASSELDSSGFNSFILNSLQTKVKDTGTRFCLINTSNSFVENVTNPSSGDLFTMMNCNRLVLKDVNQNNTFIGVNGMNSYLDEITDIGTNISVLGSQSIDLTKCGKNASLINTDNCSITSDNNLTTNFRTILGSSNSSIAEKEYSMILNSTQCSISDLGNFNIIANSKGSCSISGDESNDNTIISSNYSSIIGVNNAIYSTTYGNINGRCNAIFNSQGGVFINNSNSCIALGGEGHRLQNSNYCLVSGASNYVQNTNYSLIIGTGLLTSKGNDKIILGKYNESIDNEIFVIGVGEDDLDRKNVLDIHAEYLNNIFNSYILNGKELTAQFKTVETAELINTNEEVLSSPIEQKIIEIDIEKTDTNLIYSNDGNETSIKIKIAECLIPEIGDEEWSYEDYLFLPKKINFDFSKLELTCSNCFILDSNDKKKKNYNSICSWISENSIMNNNDEIKSYYLEILVPTKKLYDDLGLNEIEKIKVQVKGYII